LDWFYGGGKYIAIICPTDSGSLFVNVYSFKLIKQITFTIPDNDIFYDSVLH